jgi:hypothetical protein
VKLLADIYFIEPVYNNVCLCQILFRTSIGNSNTIHTALLGGSDAGRCILDDNTVLRTDTASPASSVKTPCGFGFPAATSFPVTNKSKNDFIHSVSVIN